MPRLDNPAPRSIHTDGDRFGYWTVLSIEKKGGRQVASCRCKCGTSRDVRVDQLKSGGSKSCGCAPQSPRPARMASLIGRKFGKLLVIADAGKIDGQPVAKWKCLCDCGNHCNVKGPSLKCGETKSCGCRKRAIAAQIGRSRALDISGQRFGKLLAIRKLRMDGKKSIWLCWCDCGNACETPISSLSKQTSCSIGCGHTKAPGIAARNVIISRYKSGANRRGLEWSLTDDAVITLASSHCHYCGIPPNQVSHPERKTTTSEVFAHNGIDRMDSSIGYSWFNCVPCCKNCNWAKGSTPYVEFIEWLKLAAKTVSSREERGGI